MITSHTYSSLTPGKSILITDAIHGNEPCGTLAIQKIIQEIEQGVITILKGSITFVPICNPKAFDLNVRQTEQNLNRVFRKNEIPSSYEQKLANILVHYVENCYILVDCHSGPAYGSYFVFEDFTDPQTQELAQATGMDTIVSGWPELYEESDDMDTCRYAHQMGKVGITIEGGQHQEVEAVARTYNAVNNVLRFYGTIDGDFVKNPNQQRLHMYQMVKKDKEGSFTKEFYHGDVLKVGDVIIEYADGSEFVADRDCVIVLPRTEEVPMGQEWFYLATKV